MDIQVSDQISQILKALADDSRLRILAVLAAEPLSVNEVMAVLQMGQSRVSRHLKILADAGLLRSERVGSHVYYGFRPREEGSAATRMLEALELYAGGGQVPEGFPRESKFDQARQSHLLENRRQNSLEHFQKYGIDQDELQKEYVDAEFYRNAILKLLPRRPGLTVDVGCGAGLLAERLVGRGAQVIGIDPSSNLLARARRNCPAGDFRPGSLERLPLGDGEADLVIAAMVLHHLPEPLRGLREIKRVLKPGGALIIAELERHDEDAMMSRFADFWPGFEYDRFREMLEAEGFVPGAGERGRGEGRLGALVLAAASPAESASRRKAKGGARRGKADEALAGQGERRAVGTATRASGQVPEKFYLIKRGHGRPRV